jgi:hypothetical protein
MAKVLKGTKPAELPMPDGILAARVNADSGLRDDSGGGLVEYFFSEFPPRAREEGLSPAASPGKDIRDQLF